MSVTAVPIQNLPGNGPGNVLATPGLPPYARIVSGGIPTPVPIYPLPIAGNQTQTSVL
jgi:hypothetical protein